MSLNSQRWWISVTWLKTVKVSNDLSSQLELVNETYAHIKTVGKIHKEILSFIRKTNISSIFYNGSFNVEAQVVEQRTPFVQSSSPTFVFIVQFVIGFCYVHWFVTVMW